MDFDFQLQPGDDRPASIFRELREAGPVVWSPSMQAWIVSSYEAVRTVLSDVSRFTSQGTPVAEVFGSEGMLVNDTPMHHTIRAVWAKHVGVAAMTERQDEFRSYAEATIGAALPRLKSGETIDLVPVFRDFVLKVIAGNFGISETQLQVIARWSEMSADTPALEMEPGSEQEKRHFAARQDVFDLLDELIAERQAALDSCDGPTDLTALMVAANGSNGITGSIVRDNLFNFILGALDTSEKWFGNIVCRLWNDDGLRDHVNADRSLIDPLIDEVMRLDTVAQTIQRRVRKDGEELSGQVMQAGDAVLVMLGAANRDPDVFADPDRFDLHRTVRSHLGFGFGFHHCLGLNIARQEALALISVMLDLLPDLHIVEADYGDSWGLLGPRALHVAQAQGR